MHENEILFGHKVIADPLMCKVSCFAEITYSTVMSVDWYNLQQIRLLIHDECD